MNKHFLSVALLLCLGSQTFAGSITGKLTDKDTGEPLIGANIVVVGTTAGASTSNNGDFVLESLPPGEYALRISYIGYQTVEQTVTVGASEITLNRALTPLILTSDMITVVAARARVRETPVAFMDVEKIQLIEESGSRDFPAMLDAMPGVYSTEGTGEMGASRVNVRGFDFKNIAMLINGLPVNDVEDGFQYWSNWDNLTDVTSSVQVQRGLGASNMAVFSVGGTINILTDPTQLERSVSFRQEYGAGTYLKSLLNFNSGLIDNKFAVSISLARKDGYGVIDQAWIDEYSYYGTLSYNAGRNHRLELSAVGAPQSHGQRSFPQNVGAFDKDFALDIYRDYGLGADAIASLEDAPDLGRRYNPNWGPIFNFDKSRLKEYYDGEVHDFQDRPLYLGGDKQSGNFLNSNINYYHKPHFNLNWYWQASPKLLLTNVAYYTRGHGGGAQTWGSQPRISSGEFTGQIDYQTIYDNNRNNIDPTYSTTESRTQTVMLNWTNKHYWVGLLSSAQYRLNNESTLTFGIDGRYYRSELGPEVRNLLGGDYYIDFGNANQTSPVKRLGDSFGFHYGANIRWIGGFASYEQEFGKLTAVASGSVINNWYQRRDDFKDHSLIPRKTDWLSIFGGTAKAGANYALAQNLNIYGNAGFYSKAPIFAAAIDFSHQVFDKILNEKIYSIEGGVGYETKLWKINGNLYHTFWQDRNLPSSTQITNPTTGAQERFLFLLKGIDARHMGVEADFTVNLHKMLQLDGAVSLGSWEWLNDVEATFAPDAYPDSTTTIQVFSKDLKVGGAPQTTFGLGVTVRPVTGMTLKTQWRLHTNQYAEFNPAGRRSESDRGAQSWKLPSANIVDIFFAYALPLELGGAKLQLIGRVFNLFDADFISLASDRGNHTAADALVFMGKPRYFNLGMTIEL